MTVSKKPGKVNGHKVKASVTAIIQARMGSKRLPGKVMLDLAGKPLLAHVIERAKAIEHVDTVVLATSDGIENRPLIQLAESMEVETFSGSENNVLDRYYQASEKFGGEYIVRITADNPFTDVEYASQITDIALESKFDICSPANLPIGTAVEIVKKEALNEAFKSGHEQYHYEHVTTYIKEHPELFSIERVTFNLKKVPADLRLTVDTIEDYMLAQTIYAKLYKGYPFPISDIIELVNNNPELLKINKGVQQRSPTYSAM